MLQSSFFVPPRCPGRETLDLAMRGNLFCRDTGVPVGPDNNYQCHVPRSSIRGAQKRPISFGLAPACHPHLESSPAPATNLGYPVLVPSTLPTSHTHSYPLLTSHTPLLGVWWGLKMASCIFLTLAHWSLEEPLHIRPQLW